VQNESHNLSGGSPAIQLPERVFSYSKNKRRAQGIIVRADNNHKLNRSVDAGVQEEGNPKYQGPAVRYDHDANNPERRIVRADNELKVRLSPAAPQE
jgi:hypothetical protein